MNQLLPLLILASPTPAQSDHWQLMSNFASYGPIEMEGALNSDQSAYRFVIEAKPDGSLPMVQTNVGNLLHTISPPLYLVKKRPSGKFALYAALNSAFFRPNRTSGLLLTPGEYGYVYNPPSPPFTPHHGLALLSGRWVGGAEQQNLWNFVADQVPSSFPLSNGGNARGYPFAVAAGPDGRIVALELLTAQVETPSIVDIYRLNTSGTYDLYSRHDMSYGLPEVIAILPPGNYGLVSNDGTNWSYTRRYAHVLTGRLVEP